MGKTKNGPFICLIVGCSVLDYIVLCLPPAEISNCLIRNLLNNENKTIFRARQDGQDAPLERQAKIINKRVQNVAGETGQKTESQCWYARSLHDAMIFACTCKLFVIIYNILY